MDAQRASFFASHINPPAITYSLRISIFCFSSNSASDIEKNPLLYEAIAYS